MTKKLDKFQISSHLSCGEMWNFTKFGQNSHFSTSVVWKNWNSSSCGEIPCIEIWIFSTWQISFPPTCRWSRWQISGMWVRDTFLQIIQSIQPIKSLRSIKLKKINQVNQVNKEDIIYQEIFNSILKHILRCNLCQSHLVHALQIYVY